jgi:hypothetical protein
MNKTHSMSGTGSVFLAPARETGILLIRFILSD